MEDTYKKRHFRGESAVNCTIAYRYFLKAVPVIQQVVFEIPDFLKQWYAAEAADTASSRPGRPPADAARVIDAAGSSRGRRAHDKKSE